MHTPPPRRPRRKLGFGDMFGLRSGGNPDAATVREFRTRNDDDDDDDKLKKYTPYLFLLVMVIAFVQLFIKRDVELTKFNSEVRISEMAWDSSTVTKKYFYKETSNLKDPMHLLLEIRNKDGKKNVIDLIDETTGFWEYLEPFSTISKPANSKKVHIRSYGGKERDVVLKFE